MNRAAVIEKLKATQETLLALLESSEADRFAAHIYVSLRNTDTPATKQANQASNRALHPLDASDRAKSRIQKGARFP